MLTSRLAMLRTPTDGLSSDARSHYVEELVRWIRAGVIWVDWVEVLYCVEEGRMFFLGGNVVLGRAGFSNFLRVRKWRKDIEDLMD